MTDFSEIKVRKKTVNEILKGEKLPNVDLCSETYPSKAKEK